MSEPYKSYAEDLEQQLHAQEKRQYDLPACNDTLQAAADLMKREPAIQALLLEVGGWVVSLYDEPVGVASARRLHATWKAACRSVDLHAPKSDFERQLVELIKRADEKAAEYE